jgi:hypothetical protein
MMKRLVFGASAAVLAISTTAGTAHAEPIEYRFSFLGTGTIGTQTFTNAPTTLVLFSDTTTLASGGQFSGVRYNPATLTTITISGIGTATINESMQISHSFGLGAFFAYITNSSGLTVATPVDTWPYGSWNMISNFGPVTVPLWFPEVRNHATTLGSMRIYDGGSTFTFQAIVPSPSAAALVSAGLVLGSRRRRF